MKKSWGHYLRVDFLGFTEDDYEAFYHLRLADRLRATFAFLLFVTVMAAAAIPTALYFVPPVPRAQLATIVLIVVSSYVSSFYVWFILFPKAQRHAARISWIVAGTLFSAGVILSSVLAYQRKQREMSADPVEEPPAPVPSIEVLGNDVAVDTLRTVGAWAVASGPLVVIAITVSLRWIVRITRRLHTTAARRELDLELAGQIQDRLIPPVSLEHGPLRVYARSRLALEVGGDGFDVVELEPDEGEDVRLIAAVSDVSGHGTGAGLLMALLKGALQAEVHHRANLHTLTAALDRNLHAHSTKQMYATLCAVRLHVREDRTYAEVVDAGHLPLLHYSTRSNTVERVKAGALGLGLTGKAHYRTIERDLAPGDALLLLTDGLVEAAKAEEDYFGPNRGPELGLGRVQSHFRDAVRASKGTLDPEQYVESLFQLVQEHQGNDEPPEDDQTAVCVVVGAAG